MRIIKYNTLPSTQTQCIALVHNNNLPTHTIIYTPLQTHGHGRNNTNWFSSGSLCFSYSTLKTTYSQTIACLIHTLSSFIPTTNLNYKWPNDLLLNNKKVAGVLIDKLETVCVVGIGINLRRNRFCNVKDFYEIEISDEEFMQRYEEFDLRCELPSWVFFKEDVYKVRGVEDDLILERDGRCLVVDVMNYSLDYSRNMIVEKKFDFL